MVSERGVKSPSTGQGWLKQQGKAVLASERSQALEGLFVHTTLKGQSLLPSRVYTGKCSPLLESYRKIKVCHLFHLCGNCRSGSNDICK